MEDHLSITRRLGGKRNYSDVVVIARKKSLGYLVDKCLSFNANAGLTQTQNVGLIHKLKTTHCNLKCGHASSLPSLFKASLFSHPVKL